MTVEDHGVMGGLGGAVAALLSESCPTLLRRIGVRDGFCDAGTIEWLIHEYAMHTAHIMDAVKRVLSLRSEHLTL